jgi:hypothetical protein
LDKVGAVNHSRYHPAWLLTSSSEKAKKVCKKLGQLGQGRCRQSQQIPTGMAADVIKRQGKKSVAKSLDSLDKVGAVNHSRYHPAW